MQFLLPPSIRPIFALAEINIFYFLDTSKKVGLQLFHKNETGPLSLTYITTSDAVAETE